MFAVHNGGWCAEVSQICKIYGFMADGGGGPWGSLFCFLLCNRLMQISDILWACTIQHFEMLLKFSTLPELILARVGASKV